MTPETAKFLRDDGPYLLQQFSMLVDLADKRARAQHLTMDAEAIGKLMKHWNLELKNSEGRTQTTVTEKKQISNRRRYERKKRLEG